MKQVLQSYRTGELMLADVEPPGAAPRGARIQTRASVVSAGTEKTVIELARRSLVGKARARPDLVRRVLQKVRQQGVLSTLGQVREKLNVPVPLGYSAAGVVIDAHDAPGLLPGMRVACAGAGFACHAEINQVPRNLVVPLPDGVTFEEGAFATLGAIALQSVRQAEPRLGDRVVVIGLGLLGNLCVQLAAAHGARVLGYDLSAGRAALARDLGAHATCHDPATVADAVAAFTQGHGADVVIVAASAPDSDGPMALAVELCRLRGRIVVVGNVAVNVPRNEAYLKEIDVRMSMSYGPGRYDPEYEERGHDYPLPYVRWTEQRNMAAFLEAVADRRVRLGPLISHRYPIDAALDAYALLDGTAPYLGIVLTYADGPVERAEAVTPVSAGASRPTIEAVRGRVGIGFLGAGSYARAVLLPAFEAADVDLVGVVNRTGASAAQVARGRFRWSGTDEARLLDDPSVSAIVIGTRHDLHARQVIAALRAGKHVFVEKPLCLTEAELAEVAAAAEQTGRYVQVGTNRRFSPYTAELVRSMTPRSDPLSLVVRVNAGRLDASHWLRDPAVGGGRLIGEGIHWIDWCHAVVGAPITRVAAAGLGAGPTTLGGDSFTVTLSFGDGSLAAITYAADGDRGLPKERLEVLGLGRAAVIDDFASGTAFRGGRGSRLARGAHKGVAEEVAAFVEALRTGRPAVPLDVTWHVHHAAFQAAAALASGQPEAVSWPRPD